MDLFSAKSQSLRVLSIEDVTKVLSSTKAILVTAEDIIALKLG